MTERNRNVVALLRAALRSLGLPWSLRGTLLALYVLCSFLQESYSQSLILDLGPLEDTLAGKFCPVLHKHPSDRQQGLADFDDVVMNHAVLRGWNVLGQEIYNRRTPPIHVYDRCSWCSFGNGESVAYWRLDIDDEVHYLGAEPGNRPLYYHAYKCGDYYYVQYWLFLTMNDLEGQIDQNCWHEGDWEHVSIKIEEHGDSFVPVAINFYQHYGGHTLYPGDVYWSDDFVDFTEIRNGYDEQHTHLNIWIARNSHATYSLYEDTYVVETTLGSRYEDDLAYQDFSSLFQYDQLINMGEVVRCDDAHGCAWLEHYEHQPAPGFPGLDALAFVGRFGQYWSHWGVGFTPPACDEPATPSPRSPAFDAYCHEWTEFSEDASGFGNTSSTCAYLFKKDVSWQRWTGRRYTRIDVWRGTRTLNEDVVVPSDMVVVVQPGASVCIDRDKEITVKGALIAIGTSDHPITFTRSGSSGTWGGIHFEDSSDDEACKLEYCTIEYATDGVVCNHASPTIHYCKIRHNSTGIRLIASGADVQHCQINSNSTGVYAYAPASTLELKNNRVFYNSSYGMFLAYTDNWIHDNDLYNNISGSSGTGIYCYHSNAQLEQDTVKYSGSDGIRLYYSSPDLWRNPIHDNGRNAVNCTYYSNPYFQEDIDLTGNNVIAYNIGHGVRVDGTSHPVLSLNDDDHPANNSIYSNEGRAVYSLQSEQIEASWNWWGQYPPSSSDFYGNVHYMPALFSNPNPEPARGAPKAAGSERLAESQGEINAPDDSASIHYRTGYKHEIAQEWSEAIDEYQLVVDRWPETAEAVMSLVRLPRCYDGAGLTAETKDSYLASVSAEKGDYEVGGRSDQMQVADWLDDGRYDDALAKYEELRARFPDSPIAKECLFDQWQVYFNMKEDMQAARAAMEEYEKLYPVDDFLILMKLAMGEKPPEHATEKLAQSNEGQKPEIPLSFGLDGNYPNPFNPATTLRYRLPEESLVRIDVYNTLGQRVATLVDELAPAGYYTVRWDGTDQTGRKLAAGIYLCRMQAGQFTAVRRMTLLP